ncbi:hypothetical protein F0919_16415 [Taibaiella lutea]|uniref:Signal transduction histidine kinase subgroup 3 dimerisation and phosphoacceptor domain-containing protein n=1 Tax=Taibaiella lutea TaxID=2608001 RepID=A0A5M6CB53_9BACT|nr:sensor histidine kinase [Taibaiella lutea]KAA5532374.1 hypothetical protein F0919_16415 [Taibaiella lutea]
MRHFLQYLLTITLISLLVPCNAAIIEISQGAGLPDRCINGICKDNRGLMWIGTQSGLCVYDGYEFKGLLGQSTINRVTINKMIYDNSRDLLWLATEKGLYKIRCSSFNVEMIGNGNKWYNNSVTDLLLLEDNRVFASYKDGEILEITPSGKINIIANIPAADNNKQIYPSRLRIDGNALVISMSSIGPVYEYSFGKRILSDIRNIVRNFPDIDIQDSLVSFHTATEQQVYNINIKNDSLKFFLSQIHEIHNVASIKFFAGNIVYVFCRPFSVYKIDFNSLTVEHILYDIYPGRIYKSFYIDDDNIIWVGSTKGLLKVTNEKNLFQKQLLQYPTISIRSFVMDEFGNKYAGTYSGLFRFDNKKKDWIKIGDQIPFAFTNVKGKYLYFVEEQLRIFRIEKKTGKVEDCLYKEDYSLKSKIGRSIAITSDDSGKIWIGTNAGLVIYNPENDSLFPYKIKNFLNDNIEIRYIKMMPGDKTLLCTNNGIYEIDDVNGQIWHLNTTTRPALSSNTTNFADFDAGGNLWICTEGGGINLLSYTRKNISVLDTKSGLSDNTTYGLIFHNDYAWISTYNGLSRYSFKQKAFRNFFSGTDGLTENEFNRNSYLTDNGTNNLYFGTVNGINVFNPDKLDVPSPHAKLFASTVSKWDNNQKAYVNVFPTFKNNEITLNPSDHFLIINLGLSDYSNPEKVTFSYRVKGLIEDWVTINNQHSIQLSGLGSGMYVIEIRALDSHGSPVMNEIHYEVIVLKSFYKTIWFYLLILIAISLIISYFFYLKIRNLKQLSNLRERIASDLHDDVGSLLTRITMNSDNLRHNLNTPEQNVSKLSKISSLSRYAASSMNDILWTIDSRNNFTGNLADRIREHADEMLLPLSIEIVFDIEVGTKKIISSEKRQALYLIFKESINNIVKHSKATRVNITFIYNNQCLLLRIENNGFNANEKVAYKGQGLRNIKMRADRIHASSTIKNENDHFIVEILGKAKFF